MCFSPHENVAQGAKVHIPLHPTRCTASAADTHLGSPVGTFFGHTAPQCVCTVAVQPLCGHFVSKVGQRRPKVPKRCQQGAQKLTFRSLKRHCWEPNRREWPLVKTSAGAMFSSHYEGPGPSLFAPKIDSGTHCAPGVFFFHTFVSTFGPQMPPKAPQGSPKGAQRGQKEPQSVPRDA